MTASTTYPPRTAPVRLAQLLVLLLGLVALAGCDYGSDSVGIAGTWDPVGQSATMYGVVTETQTAIDLVQPGTGAITVSGAFSLSFRYVTGRSLDPLLGPTEAFVGLTDVDPALVGVPRASLSLSVNGTGALVLFVPGAGPHQRVFELVDFDGDAPVMLTDRGVEVARIRMVEQSTGSAVTVSGSLTHALRTYSAGEETPIRGGGGFGSYSQFRRTTFEEDGDVRYPEYPLGVFRTTWVTVGADSVRVDIQYAPSTIYRFEVDERRLALTSEAISPDLCSPDCFGYGHTEAATGLTPGTLIGTRMLLTDTFARYDD